MRGVNNMITFIILLTITLLVAGVVLGLLSLGGTIFTILASDIIVALLIIWLLWRFLFKKK
jgi:hypothetical protein